MLLKSNMATTWSFDSFKKMWVWWVELMGYFSSCMSHTLHGYYMKFWHFLWEPFIEKQNFPWSPRVQDCAGESNLRNGEKSHCYCIQFSLWLLELRCKKPFFHVFLAFRNARGRKLRNSQKLLHSIFTVIVRARFRLLEFRFKNYVVRTHSFTFSRCSGLRERGASEILKSQLAAIFPI